MNDLTVLKPEEIEVDLQSLIAEVKNIKQQCDNILERLKAYGSSHTQEKPKRTLKKPIVYSMSKSAVKVRKFRAERGNAKITCKCGTEVGPDGLSRHLKSNKHFNLLAELEEKQSPLV